MTHVPSRTCVGCRHVSARSDLMRLVFDGERGTVKVDRKGTLFGRGAWVHPQDECLRSALTPARLGRAFRRPVSVGRETLAAASSLALVAEGKETPVARNREPGTLERKRVGS